MVQLSYAITVCDESQELETLLNYLHAHANLKDSEIVVLQDINKTNEEIEKILLKHNIQAYKDGFDKNFANWKNKLNSLCCGEYIFQIDADELPDPFLLNNLSTLLYNNTDIDLIWVARENFVDDITPDHIKQWNWNLDDQNRINFPDYQGRIYKNHPNIKWSGVVHETISGASSIAALPPETKFSILHHKNINKQEKQNKFYESI